MPAAPVTHPPRRAERPIRTRERVGSSTAPRTMCGRDGESVAPLQVRGTRAAANGGNGTWSSSTGASRCEPPTTPAIAPANSSCHHFLPHCGGGDDQHDRSAGGPCCRRSDSRARRRCGTRRRTPPTRLVQVGGQYPYPVGVLVGVGDEHVPLLGHVLVLRRVHRNLTHPRWGMSVPG